MRADLHMHTTFSDGAYPLEKVIEFAKKANVDVIAITDHDTFTDANMYSNEIKVINGLELSTFHNDESIHVLAYFKNTPPQSFLDLLEDQKQKRIARAFEMLKLLEKHFSIKLDKSFIYQTNSITRGGIGREIIKQTNGKYTKKYIFTHMIGKGNPAYLPSVKMETIDGIKAIKDNGGIAVLAHPMLYKEENMMEVIKMGFDGIEAIYPHHLEEIEKYRHLAKKNNIRIITGGSDFHDMIGTVDDVSSHGNIGDACISGNDLKMFLEELS